MYSLFLDDDKDTRFPPDGPSPTGGEWIIARTLSEAYAVFDKYGMPGFISFDHDLGIDENGVEEKGMHYAHRIIEIDMNEREGDVQDFSRMFSEDFDFRVHSANPVGAKNIKCLMRNYLDFIRRSA